MKQNSFLLMSLLATTLIATYSMNAAVSQRSRATAASSQLRSCLAVAAQIEVLSEIPPAIVPAESSAGRIRRNINDAATLVGISGRVRRIVEQEPRPLKDSPYAEQVTHVDFSELDLLQIAGFLKALTSTTEEHVVESIRLSKPTSTLDGEGIEQWSVELVISTIGHAPEL